MDDQISQKLIDLNHQFYQTFSASFSQTRFSVQPGVKKVVYEFIEKPINGRSCSIVDIGCGNGELARYLGKIEFKGNYTGLDSSSSLLGFSGQIPEPALFHPNFLVMDITRNGWETNLPIATCDMAVSFAVMHHIPGFELRKKIFQTIRSLVKTNGFFIHSHWQFSNSPRLMKRIIPWEKIGLSSSQLEPGDTLLDWRAETGRSGYRYVHLFTEEELNRYADKTGFSVIDSFYSDGKEGNLALYQVWKPV